MGNCMRPSIGLDAPYCFLAVNRPEFWRRRSFEMSSSAFLTHFQIPQFSPLSPFSFSLLTMHAVFSSYVLSLELQVFSLLVFPLLQLVFLQASLPFQPFQRLLPLKILCA